MNNRNWRGSVPFALTAFLCVIAVVGALTGATKPLANVPFALTGHWVYNSLLQTVFHIDGATPNIDAQAAIPSEPGSSVVQGDTSGFVVGPDSIVQFSKANLAVQQTIAPPAQEVPLGVEATGGPYLVYRNAGKIVRLGDPPATVSAGGGVADPVVTADGTVWLLRTNDGRICTLDKGANQIAACPVATPQRDPGALTLVGGRPDFVDLFTGMLHTVDGSALGPGTPLGVPVSPTSRPAAADVAGRVAILDPQHHNLVLADTTNQHAKPVTIALPAGDYDRPVVTGSAVVLVDRHTGTVLTFGVDGTPKDTRPIPNNVGAPRVNHGEDGRVYVEDTSGSHVLVVAKDGSVQDVVVGGKPTVPAPQAGEQAGAPVERPVQTQGQGGPTQERPRPAERKPAPVVPASAPGAPSAVSASPGDRSATVTWNAAADNRSPITSYRVSWRASSGETGSTTASGAARRVTVNSLTNGQHYVFTVTATNGVGTGAGASSSEVTPVAAAAAPNPTASYSNGNATLTWNTPDLGGGTLAHYLVSATGQADRTVTGTSTVYSGLPAGRTITFTVRAVTTGADGQTRTGAAGSTTLTIPSAPTIAISRGANTTSSNCHGDCAFVDATMHGFAPNTHYSITLSSTSNSNVQTESFTTNANGDATYNELDYDVPGETVWISVATPNGRITSNRIVWA